MPLSEHDRPPRYPLARYSGDARDWLKHRRLTVVCSADILSARNWEELNHIDAFLGDLRKAEEVAS